MQEKSRGVLFFAFNTAEVDYIKIAEKSARLVHKYLKLPVTLVTDNNITSKEFDCIILRENTLVNVRKGYGNLMQWRNGDRHVAYELSPYQETLLLDIDYLMLDNSMLSLFDSLADYQIMQHNNFLTANTNESMGPMSISQVWATAVVFKKTTKSKQLFELVSRIQKNYQYYCKLYQITASNFRNDYAFAIANNILAGSKENYIPWPMLTIEKEINSIELNKNNLIVREESAAHIVPRQNVHIIDKEYLLGNNFSKLVEDLCK